MSAFSLFALLLLAAATIFALSNPALVVLRFLKWELEVSLAIAVIGGAVFGGVLVFISSLLGQRHLRARVRELQVRLQQADARVTDARGSLHTPQ